MKKFFTLALAMLCTMGAMAEDYTEQMRVSMKGEQVEDYEMTVDLTQSEDGQYTLTVNNLIYYAAGMAIGNVVIDGIEAQADPDNPGVTELSVSKSIKIKSGDLSGYPVWMGPRMGEVPVVLDGKVGGGRLYFNVSVETSFYGTDVDADYAFGDIQAVLDAATTGVDQATTTADVKPVGVYDLTGRAVKAQCEGQVYVVRMSDGTVRKVMK